MINIGTIVASQEKILNHLDKSTANRDVIAKSALINFFTALPWFEKFENFNKTTSKPNRIQETVFTDSWKQLKNLQKAFARKT